MAQIEHITPEQIEQYGVVAAPDRLTGKARDNKMIFDRLVRELVAVVVNNIIDKTNELLVAEDGREENEAGRIAAETLREQAELLRVQAENLRVTSEQHRENGEQYREEQERARQEAEALRESTTQGIVAQATEQADAAEKSAEKAGEYASGVEEAKNEAETSAVNSRLWADGTVKELVYNLPYPEPFIKPGETKTVLAQPLIEGLYYRVTGTAAQEGGGGVAPLTPVEGPFTGEIIVDDLKIRNGSNGEIIYENTSSSLTYDVTVTRLAQKPDGFMSAKDWADKAAKAKTASSDSATLSALWANGKLDFYSYPEVTELAPQDSVYLAEPSLIEGATYDILSYYKTGNGEYSPFPIQHITFDGESIICAYQDSLKISNDPDGGVIFENLSSTVTLFASVSRQAASNINGMTSAADWSYSAQYSAEKAKESEEKAKEYAEQAQQAAGGTGEFLPIAGGEITGNLSVKGKISTPRIESGSPRPIEIPYANFSVGLSLDAEANTDFRGVKLQNIGEPSSDSDAATKKYVDDTVGRGGGTSGDVDGVLDAINGEKVWVPGLPDVTATDNGKFLRVVNGTWASASVPSAEGVAF